MSNEQPLREQSNSWYPYKLTRPIQNHPEVNGRWVPSIPIKAPIDVEHGGIGEGIGSQKKPT